MNEIQATQVKAARALLGLSQEELAIRTGLSITTIRKIENGEISPRSTTMNAIRHAVEDAGWEFIYPEGIRRRQDSVIIYEGMNSTDHFFDDMLDTVRKKGGEIYGSFVSQDMLIRSLGAHDKNNADRLAKLNELACLKGLVAEPDDMPILLPRFQFKTALKRHMNAVPYFVYGDKQAIVLPDGREHFQYYVILNVAMAQKYRTHFLDLWDDAIPNVIRPTAGGASRANA
ncbi:MAG: helix-turn-helix domain-containing protein [Proteobacteria bacterium]|nr:helix-turn-helix domain-containing protein [Pseudomonadota bacterium]